MNFQCEGQMSIFDFLKPEITSDLPKTISELKNYLVKTFKLAIKDSEMYDGKPALVYKKGKQTIEFSMGKFRPNVNDGKDYVSVSYNKNYGDFEGFACPCTSIESIDRAVKSGLGRIERNR